MLDSRIIEGLEVIDQALSLIASRFQKIEDQEELILSEDNLTLLDAISMRLQNVGEKIKMIEKRSPGYWKSLGIDAQPIIRFRDYISHHYEGMEYEIIMDVCRNHLPDLAQKVKGALASN